MIFSDVDDAEFVAQACEAMCIWEKAQAVTGISYGRAISRDSMKAGSPPPSSTIALYLPLSQASRMIGRRAAATYANSSRFSTGQSP